MPGALSSERPVEDANLTGGEGTSVWKEFGQDFKQVKRTKNMDRPARTGNFAVSGGIATSGFNQKAKQPSPTDLRAKEYFKPRRKRK